MTLKKIVEIIIALIFINFTKCSICGKVLKKGQKITGLPHFMGDKNNPLYKYSDTGLHQKCYDKWELKDEIEAILLKAKEDYINSEYFKEMVRKYGKPDWL